MNFEHKLVSSCLGWVGILFIVFAFSQMQISFIHLLMNMESLEMDADGMLLER